MSESKEETSLVVDPKSNSIQLRNFEQVWKLSSLLVKSDLFGTKNTNEVATKVITGLEMGISPVRAVRHIDTIDGKPSVSAQLSAAMLQMSENFDYEVDEVSVDFDNEGNVTNGLARVCISRNGEKQGCATFTWNEAVAANLTWKDNWEKYPRDMLFARAMKRAKKWYAPSVGIGREYMPDELGQEDNPTVEAPSEVIEEAQSEAEIVDEDESNPVTDVSYDPVEKANEENTKKPESGSNSQPTTKEATKTKTSQETSTDQSGNGLNMEVTTDVESETEDTEEVQSSQSSNGKSEEAKANVDRDFTSISKHKEKISDGLQSLDGLALRNAIGKWDYKFKNEDQYDGHYDELVNMLMTHIDRLSMPYNSKRKDVSPPTQKIINEVDEELQNISDASVLSKEVQNNKEEVGQWSEPAKSVFQTVLDRHETRLSAMSESNGTSSVENTSEHKAQLAEFHENLSTALTKLGMKMKNTHHEDDLQSLLSALSEKLQDFGPDGYPTEDMIQTYQRAVSPYKTVVQMRAAVTRGVNVEKFSEVVQNFGKSLREWDDREKAQKAHEIVQNEAERLENEVEDFYLQWED